MALNIPSPMARQQGQHGQQAEATQGAGAADQPLSVLSTTARRPARAAAIVQGGKACAGAAAPGRLQRADGAAGAAAGVQVPGHLRLDERATLFLAGTLKQLLGSCPFDMPGAP